VCLGLQSLVQHFGGRIVSAARLMHGKTSPIHHANSGIFSGLSNPYLATRYHSLVIDKESLPECLEITAWTENSDGGVDEIMGVRHRQMEVQGVQYHPESILTEHGHALLKNFIDRV
jgi:anthranilate synthase component 2